MYDNIMWEFKDKLINRRMAIRSVVVLCLFFLVSIATIIAFKILFNAVWISLVGAGILGIFSSAICYSSAFMLAKKSVNLRRRDFWKFPTVLKKLGGIQKNDVTILLEIIKEAGIETEQKVQEAIRHFQVLLLAKRHSAVSVISVISLVIAASSFFLPTVYAQSVERVLVAFLSLIGLIIWVALLCLFAKLFYKTVCYELGEYALLVRIEAALSEIWIKQLL